jgi:hypothetical protein
VSSSDSPPHTVDFVLLGNLEGVFFNPLRPDGIKIVHPTIGLTLEFKSDPDDDGTRFRPGLTCRGELLRVPVPADQWIFIDALIEGRFEPYSEMPVELPLRAYGEEQIGVDGIIRKGFPFPMELCPPGVQELAKRIAAEMFQEAVRAFKLLRWQQAIDGPHWPFTAIPSLYWRTSEGLFYHVPRESRGGQSKSPTGITWREQDEREFGSGVF